MEPYEANEIDLTTFSPVLASYGPKGIFAPAALVTEDNIGQIALQFERDVEYPFPNGTGIPYIRILASRTTEQPIELNIAPGFWIVLVWGEIHLFKDGLFQKTFQIDISTDPEKGLTEEEYKERLAKVSEQIGEPATPRVGPDYQPGILYKSEGQDPSVYEQATKDLNDTLERPPWIPNSAIPMMDSSTGNQVWLRPEVYEDLSEDAKALFKPVETDSEKTTIVPAVGELDTMETNGKLD